MYPFVQSQRSSARLPRLLGFAGYEEFAVPKFRNEETERSAWRRVGANGSRALNVETHFGLALVRH